MTRALSAVGAWVRELRVTAVIIAQALLYWHIINVTPPGEIKSLGSTFISLGLAFGATIGTRAASQYIQLKHGSGTRSREE